MSALPNTFPILPERFTAAFAASVDRLNAQLDRAAEVRRVIREDFYARAKEATQSLTDDQRLDLAAYLIDQLDCDAPDLRTEAESLISDLRRAIEEQLV